MLGVAFVEFVGILMFGPLWAAIPAEAVESAAGAGALAMWGVIGISLPEFIMDLGTGDVTALIGTIINMAAFILGVVFTVMGFFAGLGASASVAGEEVSPILQTLAWQQGGRPRLAVTLLYSWVLAAVGLSFLMLLGGASPNALYDIAFPVVATTSLSLVWYGYATSSVSVLRAALHHPGIDPRLRERWG